MQLLTVPSVWMQVSEFDVKEKAVDSENENNVPDQVRLARMVVQEFEAKKALAAAVPMPAAAAPPVAVPPAAVPPVQQQQAKQPETDASKEEAAQVLAILEAKQKAGAAAPAVSRSSSFSIPAGVPGSAASELAELETQFAALKAKMAVMARRAAADNAAASAAGAAVRSLR